MSDNDPLDDSEIVRFEDIYMFFLALWNHDRPHECRLWTFSISENVRYDTLGELFNIKIELPRNKFFTFLLGKKFTWRQIGWNDVGPWWAEIRKQLPLLEEKRNVIVEIKKQKYQEELEKMRIDFLRGIDARQ